MLKKTISVLVLLFSFLGISQAQENIELLKVQDFKEQIDSDDIQLIDVRTLEEFKKGHIKNALLIDFYTSDFKEKLQQLDAKKAIYVYCAVGGRSRKTAKLLSSLGFPKIYDLKGGYRAWIKAGYNTKKYN